MLVNFDSWKPWVRIELRQKNKSTKIETVKDPFVFKDGISADDIFQGELRPGFRKYLFHDRSRMTRSFRLFDHTDFYN